MASKGVNKCIIVGNLGNDPEIRTMPNGNTVANISVATSESWKDQNGQPQERTEWHRITIYGKLAEIVGQYLTKGSQAYFEGKLQTRKWQDQSGQDRYTTEIVADSMQMLGGGNRSNNGGNNNGNGGQYQKPAQQQNNAPQNNAPQQNQNPPASDFDDDFSDDIPFA